MMFFNFTVLVFFLLFLIALLAFLFPVNTLIFIAFICTGQGLWATLWLQSPSMCF